MASSLTPTLTKKEFTNWIKGALALNITKDGLTDFVSTEVDQHHQRLLQLVPTSNAQNKCSCTIKKLPLCYVNINHSHIVQGPKHLCSRGVCNILMDSICKDHRFNKPSWKNTDPQKWCTDAFEIAKCFMSDGYSKKSFFNETDFNGILSVIINSTAFQTKIHASLASEPNICTEARKVGHDIRHSPDHLLSDSDLRDYIDILINLLCDPACLLNDPSATIAVKKLRMLKTNDLTIYEKDITEVLQDNIKETFSDQHKNLVQKIQDHYSKLKTDSIAEIDSIVADCKNDLEELTKKHKKDITKHAKRRKLEIRKRETKEKMEIERKRKDLQEDLINHYSNNEARIPIVPLVENRNAPLVDIFVRPPIHVKDVPFCKEQNADRSRSAKTKVSSLKDLFTKDDKDFYRQIYIEAQAGYGKTSFSQSLAITWCQAHKPERELTGKYLKDDIKTMKKIDFLFLLHLRDYHSSSNCILDDLIFEMVSGTLARRTQYSHQFILDTLNNCRCIVILDGLDEWAHPITCRRKPEIPHNNHHYKCTVICTTRPWKMSTIGLSGNHIDRYVELSLLDKESSKKLEKIAIGILNKNKPSNARKNVSDFREAVSKVKDDVLNTPYVKLQLIALWFEDRLLGKTRCEVYSNVTDFTLERADNQRELLFTQSLQPENVVVPTCLRNNATCVDYLNPLLKLGKLAFHALSHNIEGSTLIFERKIVLAFLETVEVDFFLKVGLLSQTEDTQNVSTVNYNISFQHKSMQEYFAALYLATSSNTQEADTQIILKWCKSLADVLEMSQVFTFLCGMNPNMYSDISRELQNVVERDNITGEYRATANHDYIDLSTERYQALEDYQSMQIACFQEAWKNNGSQCTLLLQDIFLYGWLITDDDLSALEMIATLNTGKIKSLFVAERPDFLHKIKPCLFQSLQKVALQFDEYDEIYTKIIYESAATLNSLQFVDMDKHVDIYIPILPGLNSLQAIGLDGVKMSHEDINSIFRYIENRAELTHISLQYLRCADHLDTNFFESTCPGADLNLGHHDQLLGLDLVNIPLHDLHVNNSRLEKCFMDGELMPPDVLTSLFADLHGAPVLSYLKLRNIRHSHGVMACAISTLLQLQKLDMEDIDLLKTALYLSPHMTRLESLFLSDITKSTLDWRSLIDSIFRLPPSACVRVSKCFARSEEWEDIIQLLRENGYSAHIDTLLGTFISVDFTNWAG